MIWIVRGRKDKYTMKKFMSVWVVLYLVSLLLNWRLHFIDTNTYHIGMGLWAIMLILINMWVDME